MAGFWKPNISGTGRLIRGVSGAISLGAAAYFVWQGTVWWLGALLAGAGVFMLFEATRGWCVMRACGVRTRW